MQFRLLLLPLLLLPLAFAACGGSSPHERQAKKIDSLAGDLVEVLEGIQDADSAQAAKGKLQKIAERLAKAIKEGNGLGEPSAEAQKAIEKKYIGPDSNTSRIGKEMQRVALIPGAAAALEEVSEAMLQSL